MSACFVNAARSLRAGTLVAVTLGAMLPPLHAQRAARGSEGATSPRSSWLWATTGEQGWDSNARYLEGTDPDFINRLTSSLSVLRQAARGGIGLNVQGSAVRFDERSELNMFAYDAALSGTRRFTPRTAGAASTFYRNMLSPNLVGVPQGVQLPILALARQRAAGGTANLDHRFSPANSVRVDVGYTYVTFDIPELIDGGAVSARLEGAHRYTSQSALLLHLEAQEGRANGLPLSVQSGSVGWEPGRRGGRLRLLAGAARIAAGGPSKTVPTGQIDLRDSVGRGVLNASVTRSVAQAFGIGALLISNVANVTYDVQARRGNFLTAGASLGDSRETTGSAVRFRSSAVSLGLRRVLQSGVTFGCGLAYRQRDDITRASGLGGQLQFGYTVGSR